MKGQTAKPATREELKVEIDRLVRRNTDLVQKNADYKKALDYMAGVRDWLEQFITSQDEHIARLQKFIDQEKDGPVATGRTVTPLPPFNSDIKNPAPDRYVVRYGPEHDPKRYKTVTMSLEDAMECRHEKIVNGYSASVYPYEG